MKKIQSFNYWHFGGNRLLLLTKNALIKGDKKFGQGPPPPHPSFAQNPKEQQFFFVRTPLTG